MDKGLFFIQKRVGKNVKIFPKTKKPFLKLFLLLFSSVTTLASAYGAFTVAEKFFFDKLFYKKSPIHGYSQYNSLNFKNSPWIEKRINDLRLTYAKLEKNIQVLGVKTADEYTIALIGDSMAYGLGVRENESFGRILEKKLNKLKPTKVYVLALPGDGIVENYAKFLRAKNSGRFDLYIITVFHNDLIYDHADRYPNEKETYKYLNSSCPGEEFIPKKDWGELKWDQMLPEVFVPSYSPSFSNHCYFKTAIKDMIKTTDKLIFFSLDILPEEKPDILVNKMYKWTVENYKNSVVNAGGSIFSIDDSNHEYQKVSDKENHPSARIHRFYAQVLFQEITTNPRWGFTIGQSD